MSGELLESVDNKNPDGNNRSLCGPNGKGFHLYPVSMNDSGEGLPYAPENWPNPGDKWIWKVGRRIGASGYFLDRYLYLPRHLRDGSQGKYFASKSSLAQYVRTRFPDVNIDLLFASFCWKIPSKQIKKDDPELFTYLKEPLEYPESEAQMGKLHCIAGNRACISLDAEANSVLEVMACDICCSEPGFCRDCCCILCCGQTNEMYGGYSYIRCEALIEGYVCGHRCHIECALRAYMAGTVGGSIGLEVEYYCRRCDSRTDLLVRVAKLLQTCKSIDSRDDIMKILNVGACLLRGSKKACVELLSIKIDEAIKKLKNGTCIEDIWKTEDLSAVIAGVKLSSKPNPVSIRNDPRETSKFDPLSESLKLEDEIDSVLKSLRESQEVEYRLAVEKLSFQRNHIQNLYQQLDKEKGEYQKQVPTEDRCSLVLSTINQIKRELSTLKDMKEIAKGFGRVSKRILKEQFLIEDA